MILDPINDPGDEDEDTLFPCACGDESCIGHNDDPSNIRIGKAWYSADCAMANAHPVVVEGREQEQRNAERLGK